jgi:hypothetical protein
MATAEAKRIFRARAGLCELQNAQLKARQAITQVLARGLDAWAYRGLPVLR